MIRFSFKNQLTLIAMVFLTMTIFIGCTGPQGIPGPPGVPGQDGQDGLLSEVFELQNVNFTLDQNNEYTIYQTLNPNIYASDNILIYRMSTTIDPETPVWQLIPRTLFLQQGELDYDYDFSKEDFKIYAGGTFDVALAPTYITNQTFRIVIIPGYFSNRMADKVDFTDYNAVIKAYGLDDSHIKVLNGK